MPPSRQRSSGGGTAAQASVQRRPLAELPPYQSLSNPLNAYGQRELANFTSKHPVRSLREHLSRVADILGENAGAVNDVVYANESELKKSRARLSSQRSRDEAAAEEGDSSQGQTASSAEEERLRAVEEGLESTRAKVQRMTEQMEESLRKALDGAAHVDFLEDALKGAASDIATATSTTQATQTQQSQTRASRQQQGADNGEQDDEVPGSLPDFDPTDPSNRISGQPASISAALSPLAPSTLVKSKMEASKDRYNARPLRSRYAEKNPYRNFKRLLHDAAFPDGDAPPLAHESTWFNERAVAAPGVTSRSTTTPGRGTNNNQTLNDNDADEEDDEIAISKESISTKCPLTLVDFSDPVTSLKCPHSFEREAIVSLIDSPANTVRIGGSSARGARDGERAVQCPVPGCQHMLRKQDLGVDVVLVRKIARLIRARVAAEEEEEDGEEIGGRRGKRKGRNGKSVHEIESGSEDEDEDDEEAGGGYKVERSTAAR